MVCWNKYWYTFPKDFANIIIDGLGFKNKALLALRSKSSKEITVILFHKVGPYLGFQFGETLW